MTDLHSLSATALSGLIAARRLSAAELMAATLARIDAVNPKVNAIVSLRDRDALMAEAAAADAGPSRGWLHGIPLALKDLVATAGIRTTWGSPIHADHVPATDDLLAARLRGAGAILIGKTNTPEFGLGSHSFNPVHGTTLNPYDLGRTAGGSSGGAAAALAARLLAVADGSDMMGSLRNPAAFCNVYGFRPTWGLVPAEPEGESFLQLLATDGPLARGIEDLARLLETLAGPDPRVPLARPWQPFAAGLDAPVAGRRIGWVGDWAGYYPTEPGLLELCENALEGFAELGCAVEPVVPPFDPGALWRAWLTLRGFANASRRRALWDDPASRTLLKPEAIWEIEQGLQLSAQDIHDASLIRSEWFRCLAELFARFDALALPAAQVFPFDAALRHPEAIAGRSMDTYHRWMEIVVPASLAGVPALAVPAGFDARGLPMGLQLIGPAGGDAALLQLGQAWHRATDWPGRAPPRL
jgi:amidase